MRLFEREEKHNGYRLLWTGWKDNHETTLVVGQWIGWPIDGVGITRDALRRPYLYVNVPGFIGGGYLKGATFNLTSFDDRYVDLETAEETKATYIDMGLGLIKGVVDVVVHTDVVGPWNGNTALLETGSFDRIRASIREFQQAR